MKHLFLLKKGHASLVKKQPYSILLVQAPAPGEDAMNTHTLQWGILSMLWKATAHNHHLHQMVLKNWR